MSKATIEKLVAALKMAQEFMPTADEIRAKGDLYDKPEQILSEIRQVEEALAEGEKAVAG